MFKDLIDVDRAMEVNSLYIFLSEMVCDPSDQNKSHVGKVKRVEISI